MENDNSDTVSTSSAISEKSISGFDALSGNQPQNSPSVVKEEDAPATPTQPKERIRYGSEQWKQAERDREKKKAEKEEAEKRQDELYLKKLQSINMQDKVKNPKILGDKLCQYELNLYEYSAFSLCEEIDIFYCQKSNLETVGSVEYDEDTLRSKLQVILEFLEQQGPPERQSKILQELYIFSMGEYLYKDVPFEIEDSPQKSTKFKKKLANQMLNECGACSTFCQLFADKIAFLLDGLKPEEKCLLDQNLQLELELRIVLNVLINFLLYNNDDQCVINDFTSLDQKVEQTCLSAIQQSLDTTFIPVRKIILILHIYFRYLFGEKREDPKHKEFYSNLKYLKEYLNYNLFEKVPRYLLKTDSKVERFYKRNMNKNHPIPHIIVVGILRVLLSTCPNTKKNTTGGVQIHREWSSCLKLYLQEKDLFDAHGFKSDLFPHEAITKEAKRLKKLREESEQTIIQKPENDAEEDDEEEKKTSKAEEPLKDEDLFDMEEYKYENDRHRIITAMIISDYFIYMLKHFKANCINQSVYLSQLLVDANGVLVLLKFLNQGFEKFQFGNEDDVKDDAFQQLDKRCKFLNLNDNHDLNSTIEETVSQLLRLTYKLCRNQKERIKAFLIQYKGCLIMRKLINKFNRPDLCKNAAKVIKIQIRQIGKNWRKENMKIISTVYQHVDLKNLDDWLGWKKEKESGITCPNRDQAIEEEKQWYTQDQIRQLNADFNYENYEIFYEEKESQPENEDESEDKGDKETSRSKKASKKKLVKDQEEETEGLHEAVSRDNLLYKLEAKATLPPGFEQNYEQWLEDEVWSYFD